MTPKQTQRLKKKIAAIKRALGGYDDSQGLYYLSPRYFLQLANYQGAPRYIRWFAKIFPDDIGILDFLFEWAILLFKTGHIALARGKVWQTYCANTYVLDKFLGRPVQALPKHEWSNLAQAGFTAYFPYSYQQTDLFNFSQWLATFRASTPFLAHSARYLSIQQQLVVEEDEEIREYLHQDANQLENQIAF